jgi:uncharacterized protein (TIGR03435 family)
LGGREVIGLAAQEVRVSDFAQQLSRQLGAAVVDRTGLTGNYDFTPQWAGAPTPDEADNPSLEKSAAAVASLSTALEQQLGLRFANSTAADAHRGHQSR